MSHACLVFDSDFVILVFKGVRLWNEIVRRKSECSISLLDNDQESSVISHPVVYGLESVVQAQVRQIALQIIQLSRHHDLVSGYSVHINFADMHMKCGKAWLAANRSDDSEREFNLALQFLNTQDGVESRNDCISKDHHILEFEIYLGKAQLEWNKDIQSAAFFNLNKSISQPILSSLGFHQVEQFARLVIRLSKTATQVSDKITLCEMALSVLLSQNSLSTSNLLTELKCCVLLSLVIIYLNAKDWPNAERRSESAIEEFPGCLSMYYLNMKAMIAKGSATPYRLEQIFMRAVSNSVQSISESSNSMKTLMSMVHMMAKQVNSDLALTCIDSFMDQEMVHLNTKSFQKNELNEKILVTKLYLVTSMEVDPTKTIMYVKATLDHFGLVEFESSTARTCQMILWKSGDKAAQICQWEEAISWYRVCLTLISDNMVDRHNDAMLHRKIALCQFELHHIDEALTECIQAKQFEQESDMPPTLLMLFILYLEKGDEAKAMENLAQISIQSRLDLYIHAATVAQKKENQGIVRNILKMVVTSGHIDWSLDDTKCKVLTIIRCLIRLTKTNEPNKIDVQAIVSYANKAYGILKLWSQNGETREANTESFPRFETEVDWLLRVCWNTAIQIGHLDISNTATVNLFEIVSNLTLLFSTTTISHLKIQKSSLFIAALGQLFIVEKGDTTKAAEDLSKATVYIHEFENAVQSLSELDNTFDRMTDISMIQLLPIKFEIYVRQKKWSVAQSVIKNAQDMRVSCNILEQLAEITLRLECPDHVAYDAIKTMLDEQMRQSQNLNIIQFSCWFRTLVTIALHQDKDGYKLFEQVHALIKSASHSTPYPENEIKWLMISAWNAGCERWSVHHLEGGRQWSEMALSLGLYLENSEQLLTKMRVSYLALMESCNSSNIE
ncbi:Testis-expressed protein 11 [Batrachochytrium dendrobatidis]|nr:Testis-expressed protein 11 [Batrachochytrium dendrobatidis]